MNVKSQRKLNWLKQVGGDEAVNALGSFVEKASEYAENNNIPYKEHGEENKMNDILDGVQIPDLDVDTNVSKDENETAEFTTEDLVGIESETADTKPVEKEDTVEPETIEPVTVETNVSNVESETRIVTFKELDETIDTFVNEVFEPLMAIVKELKDENAALVQRLEALETKATVVKEVAEDLDFVPAASVASLIKERLTNRLEGFIVTKESIADEKLVEQKPKENVNNNEHFFSDFVNGL